MGQPPLEVTSVELQLEVSFTEIVQSGCVQLWIYQNLYHG